MSDLTRTGSTLLAGTGETDITPELGVQLAGTCGRKRPAENIVDHLYARALFLKGEQQEACCIISANILGATNQWSDRIRSAVSERIGIPSQAVVFHALQNHAAPMIGNIFAMGKETRLPDIPFIRGSDEEYNEFALDRIVAAAAEAATSPQPVTLQGARGIDGRVAFNRRFLLRNGTVRRHGPKCKPDILCAEGVTDPEVGLLRLNREDDTPLAVVLHHSCHPCHGLGANDVIGDWVGKWADLARNRLDNNCMPIVINGCCGNIHHNDHLDPQQKSDYRSMAEMLMETTERALENIEDIPSLPFRFDSRTVYLPLRPVPEEELAAAREMERKWPEPKWQNAEKTAVDRAWVDALTKLDYHDRRGEESPCRYEIQAVRLGDATFVTLMGEPFVEGQLSIKLNSPAPYTFVAHYCGGHAGYIPTANAFEYPGEKGNVNENLTNFGFKFMPDALDHICNEAEDLLQSFF